MEQCWIFSPKCYTYMIFKLFNLFNPCCSGHKNNVVIMPSYKVSQRSTPFAHSFKKPSSPHLTPEQIAISPFYKPLRTMQTSQQAPVSFFFFFSKDTDLSPV